MKTMQLIISRVKKYFTDWKFVHQNDPVKKCELYKDKGCSHVDGMLCDFPNCSMNAKYLSNKAKRDELYSKTGVEKYVDLLRYSDRYMRAIFKNGGCYYFYLILKHTYPDAVGFINKDMTHVVTKIFDTMYDIDGVVENEADFRPLTASDILICRTWSFAKNYKLNITECPHCNEPISI